VVAGALALPSSPKRSGTRPDQQARSRRSMGLPRPPGSPIALLATDWSSSLSAAAASCPCAGRRECRSALLGTRRSRATCENAGLHSGEPPIADKDEAAGSSPARPTTPQLTCGNARRGFSFNGGCFREGLRTAVLERIPALLSSDNYGSSVEREAQGQVLWRVRVKVAGEGGSCERLWVW
jgi:hypothetical protein